MRSLVLALTLALGTAQAATPAFRLSSPDFADRKPLARAQEFNAFGCSGGNTSPALRWEGAPAGTKSFALMMHDPDAPTGSGWWHWVAWNIPAGTTALPAGAGDPGAGLLPIRGHSNVQGMGSVGVAPLLKQAILQRYEERLGVKPPTSPGLDTMACMDAADRGEMDVALCLGGNLYGSNPDAVYAQQALAKIG